MERKFKIAAINIKPSDGVLVDVIDTINWIYTLTDLVENLTVETYGMLKLPTPVPETFISFNEVTEEICIDWLVAKLDISTLDTILDAKMVELKTPVTIIIKNPFDE